VIRLYLQNYKKIFVLEFTKEVNDKIENEQDLLIAVAKSKDVCKQYMTSAAIIVRGLPVKLID
jgi:hypothetical protein